MAYSLHSVDARTGKYLAELPRAAAMGPLAVTIGQYEQQSFTLPYPDSVTGYANRASDWDALAAIQDLNDWKTATRPGATNIIAVDEVGYPFWGGLVLKRTTDHSSVAQLDTVTLEAYTDRRYTGNYNTSGDQNAMVTDLINQFVHDGVLPGIPIRIVNSPSAQSRTVQLFDTDDKTVYSNIGMLAGLANGPQWTIGWEWQSSPRRITPVAYVADRLGAPMAAGLHRPNALFNMPGCVTSFQLIEDWTSTAGANRVTMTGQGSDRPQDTEDAADFAGRPMFEYRKAPATSTLDTLTLQQHALAALMVLQYGGKVLTLTANISDPKSGTPRLGVDFDLGDDIGYDLFAPTCIDGSLRNGIGACIGWRRDPINFSPKLYTPDATAL